MAKETVQAVRKAEVNAERMVKEALSKKEAIISEATQKAKELSASMLKETQMNAEKEIKDAVLRSNHILEEAKKKAEKEVQLLIELAKGKEQAGIDLVVSNVV